MRLSVTLLIVTLVCSSLHALAEPPRPMVVTQLAGRIRAEPLVGPDGTVYVASDDGTVRAIAKGAVRYIVKTGARVRATPVLDETGALYIGTEAGDVLGIEPSGALRFRARVGGPIIAPLTLAPAKGASKAPLVLVAADGLYGFTREGLMAFHHVTPSALRGAPAVHPGGFAIVGTPWGTLLAVDLDGRRRWQVSAFGAIECGVAIAADQAIIAATTLGSVLRFTPEGRLTSAIALPGAIFATPSIGEGGSLLIGVENGALYALTSALEPRWRFATHGPIRAAARVGRDGMIFVGSTDDTLYALARDGSERFRYNLGSDIDAPPALSPRGTLYVGTDHGTLYALPSSIP
jgi:outer membrane protein assembly factor BamB